jgi:glycosyltransferase involved in cell wall biosynthesis
MITKSGEKPLPARLESRIRIREIGRVGNGAYERYFGSARVVLNTTKAIIKENAHIYYQRTASAMTGFVGLSCFMSDRPFVFGSSSYWDSNDSLNGRIREDTPLTTLGIASPIYRFGLSRANVIVSQTDGSTFQFRKRFPSKKIVKIPSLATLPPSSPEKDAPPFVLYVSRLIWYRRPFLFLQVAKTLPQIRFVLAGYGPLQSEIQEEVARTPNVTFLGPISWEESVRLIGRASAFLNTSSVEGFPNTLLECLACRTPYVSMFDPDEIICRTRIGYHVKDITDAANAIQEIFDSPSTRLTLTENGVSYLNRFHSPESIVAQYEELFLDNARRPE